MMRIWFDVITPKQARLMTSIANYLKADYLMTCKGLSETVRLLGKLGASYLVIGRYSSRDLRDKLLAYAERVSSLAELASQYDPDFLISFSSPEAVRVAFGLSIKSITLNDTPHAYHVARLTFPLSWRVVYPRAVPDQEILKLGASRCSLVPYDGVDEVAWVKDFITRHSPKEREFVVFIRPEETGASYLLGKGDSISLRLIDSILEAGAKVLVKPRYESQVGYLRRSYGNRIIILHEPVDTLALFSRVSLVVTGGGTMARESALLGTPSISTFPLKVRLHVNEYLAKRGFPIWRVYNLDEGRKLVSSILRDPDRFVVDTRGMLEDLEDPRSVIRRLIDLAGECS